MAQKIDAVVLMGFRANEEEDPICVAEGVKHKSLAKIGERTIIEIVLQALLFSPRVGNVYICVQKGFELPQMHFAKKDSARIKCLGICRDTPAGTIIEFVKNYASNLPVLVVTSDLALLSSAIIDDFIDKSLSVPADLSIGLANTVDTLSLFPDAARTCLKFRDGWFNVCNLYLVNDRKCLDFLDFWSSIGGNRKKPLILAYDLGFFNLLNYMLRFSSLEASVKRLGRKFCCRLASVQLRHAQVAIDVDKISDLAMVREYINNKIGICNEK